MIILGFWKEKPVYFTSFSCMQGNTILCFLCDKYDLFLNVVWFTLKNEKLK